jgi:hypothetical protein
MPGSVEIQAFLKSMQQEVRPRLAAAGLQACNRFANHVISEAVRICPIETGNLRASAHVQPPENDNGLISQRIGFNAAYALPVHERLDLHHAPPTQAKFLETAMRANAGRFAPYVIDAMKKELG